MNKQRRAELSKALDLMQQALDIINNAKDEEVECFENFPEPLQESEKGEKMQSAIDEMDVAIDSLDQAISSIQQASE